MGEMEDTAFQTVIFPLEYNGFDSPSRAGEVIVMCKVV